MPVLGLHMDISANQNERESVWGVGDGGWRVRGVSGIDSLSVKINKIDVKKKYLSVGYHHV